MTETPTLTEIFPAAALPGGEVELRGSALGAGTDAASALTAQIAGVPAHVLLSRPDRMILRVPAGVLPGNVVVSRGGVRSNPLPLAIGVPLAENLHPVASPVADLLGNLYTTLSGRRGQQTPVSIFRIGPGAEGSIHELRPFVRDILNPTGLAFGPDGDLFVSSRAEGTIYRVNPQGEVLPFAEGLGIATGVAFDPAGDLFVGDRSGTIFKIRMNSQPRQTFVFATLEPSIAAYHLAFDAHGVLYVTGPTTASNQVIHAIDRDGTTRVFFRGLGRAQGLAFDGAGNLFVAASLRGERGIVRVTPDGKASLVVSGCDLVGICLLPQGRAALTTREALYEVRLDH
jgi:sugar lactone lactonase YvrE